MTAETSGREERSDRQAARSGAAAAVGGLLWTATPWIRTLVLGDRPYVATGFDAVSLVGLGLMGLGLFGTERVFGGRYGRLGRAGAVTAAAGIALVAGVTTRAVFAFVAAGFRPVPAVGEDPTGLIVTYATLVGLCLAVCGAGLLGLALRRVADPPRAAVGLLVSAPAVPLLVIVLRLSSLLPLPIGRLAVGTNAVLVPFGLAWIALCLAVRSRARTDPVPTGEPDSPESRR